MIKRRSNKLSPTQELHNFTFFTDRNLGHSFPNILKKNGFSVEIHDDHFEQDTLDTDWLKIIGEKKWIVITHDKNIRKKSYEVNALMNAKIKAFFLIGAAPFPSLAKNLINSKHKLVKFINKNHYPFMAKVYMPTNIKSSKSGEIKMWYTHDEWLANIVRNELK